MLSVKNLSFAFGGRPLFRSISFDVDQGGLVRLAGENGTGKTTLMSLIAGLRTGYTGTIKFLDSGDSRQVIGWLPPDANALDPNLSALANLRFWQDLRNVKTEDSELIDTLAAWGLTGSYRIKELPVGLFSTGMKRRLSMARLVLAKSKLWLLDEPLFGLDDAGCANFKNSLNQHLRDRGAAIIITHDERIVNGLNVKTVRLDGQGSHP